jgi:tubulin-specific chaperone D
LEPFQEWPQLLDPHLQNVLPPLIDAFLIYLTKHREQYGSRYESFQGVASIYPLPRAICKILYVLCKVRGVKVISRFLNNEPRYLELMLNAFIEWDSGAVNNKPTLMWEERYVMLMWLSHLLLAPFDLASISTDNISIPYDNLMTLHLIPPETPRIAQSLLSLCLKFMVVPGKEREAATILLARLILRTVPGIKTT